MRISRLLFGHGLHVGKAGLEFLADHLVHADEYANDFRNVGTGAVHAPGDIRGVAFGLERKFGRVMALDWLDEIQLDRDLRWRRCLRDLHAPLADLVVAFPRIHGALAAGCTAVDSLHRWIHLL